MLSPRPNPSAQKREECASDNGNDDGYEEFHVVILQDRRFYGQ